MQGKHASPPSAAVPVQAAQSMSLFSTGPGSASAQMQGVLRAAKGAVREELLTSVAQASRDDGISSLSVTVAD